MGHIENILEILSKEDQAKILSLIATTESENCSLEFGKADGRLKVYVNANDINASIAKIDRMIYLKYYAIKVDVEAQTGKLPYVPELNMEPKEEEDNDGKNGTEGEAEGIDGIDEARG